MEAFPIVALFSEKCFCFDMQSHVRQPIAGRVVVSRWLSALVYCLFGSYHQQVRKTH